jgi:hypothetical protein
MVSEFLSPCPEAPPYPIPRSGAAESFSGSSAGAWCAGL